MPCALMMVAVALVLTSCRTPESNAWGLPREDVRETGRLVRAQTSTPITGYTRDQQDLRVIDIWVTEPMVLRGYGRGIELATTGKLSIG
jgi:hypothetical protein